MNLTFEWNEDVEKENRGFICHKLSAFLGNIEAGYIKVAYIPKENYKKYYPTIWEFKSRIQGWCCSGPWDSTPLTDEQKLQLMQSYMREYSDWSSTPISKVADKDQIAQEIKNATKSLEDDYHKDIKEFEGYHVDRPYIAYISVEPKYRRDGIATTLMFECHKKLQEKGLRLHLSETICDGGKAFFADFIEKHKDKMVLKKVPHFKDKKLHELI